MVRAFLTFSSLTLLSRILGFVRDIYMAAILGAGMLGDAFFIAFRLPNLFRAFFAEGALNGAFVPIYSAKLAEDEKSAYRFASAVLFVLICSLCVVTALAMLFMPSVMRVFAPGFSGDADKLRATVYFAKIMFPYLACISLASFFGAMLQSRGSVAAMAFSPAILNIILIASVVYHKSASTPAHALSYGVLIAGIVQLLVMLWCCIRRGVRLTISTDCTNADVRNMFIKLVPIIISSCITRLNILVGVFFISRYAGAVSWVYYADRLQQIPVALIGVAMGYVLLPTLSNLIHKKDYTRVLYLQNRALEVSLLLACPVFLAFFVIPQEIIAVMFVRGAFGVVDGVHAGEALKAFSVGVVPFVVNSVLNVRYFAAGNTSSPMKYSFVALLFNVLGAYILCGLVGFQGAVWSVSIAAWVNMILLFRGLGAQKMIDFDDRLVSNLRKMLVALLCMVFVMSFVVAILSPLLQPTVPSIIRIVPMFLVVLLTSVSYFWSLSLLGVYKVRDVLALIKNGDAIEGGVV